MSVFDFRERFTYGWVAIYSSTNTDEFYKAHDRIRASGIQSKTKLDDNAQRYDENAKRGRILAQGDKDYYTILVKKKDIERAKQVLGIEY